MNIYLTCIIVFCNFNKTLNFMKKIFFSMAVFCALNGNAQNYLISFTGVGESTTINAVKVENLTKGTTATLNGSDILRLTGTVGISQVDYEKPSGIKMFPNPMSDNSTIEIFPPVEGDAIISVSEITGKKVYQTQSYLEKSRQQFKLSGIKNGFYLININGNNYQLSGKLLCNGKSNGKIIIERVSNNFQAVDKKVSTIQSKGAMSTIDMLYSSGDRLIFTAVSGNYSTVITDIPEQDKTIAFNFISCTDGDNINYPVVQIGSQVWMAENLKTTRYNDGTAIPLVIGNTDWSALATPGYCWFNNNESVYKPIYGALYNWYTGNTGNLCPTGWHLPTDAEWTTLTTYLGGESIASGKLKKTGTTLWQSPNYGATNESGFSALPGGYRGFNGSFTYVGKGGYWWSATEDVAKFAWGRGCDYSIPDLFRYTSSVENGISIRCLKD
jgi:uncharacterized protein (TIGR02145 family)